MTSRWSDLDRPPLSEARIARAVTGGLWRTVRVVETTGSTNADVADAARSGSGAGLVVVAEEQSSGRGRLGRTWSAPARSSVLMSLGVAPTVDPRAWGLIPLLAGVAVADAIEATAQVEVRLKWPNDLLAGGRKLGGILCERIDDTVVIGIGVNVSVRAAELPRPDATSIALQGGVTDREPLIAEIARGLERQLRRWHDISGAASAVIPAYRSKCATIGSDVTIGLPDAATLKGRAVDVDDTGRLIVIDVDTGDRRAISVGDVTQVRPVQTGTTGSDG